MSAARSQSDVAACLAAEHADGNLHACEFRALELDRIDARQKIHRRMRDEPGVQEVPDVGGVAAARILVVIRDEIAKLRGITLFRRGFSGIDECADLVLGCA